MDENIHSFLICSVSDQSQIVEVLRVCLLSVHIISKIKSNRHSIVMIYHYAHSPPVTCLKKIFTADESRPFFAACLKQSKDKGQLSFRQQLLSENIPFFGGNCDIAFQDCYGGGERHLVPPIFTVEIQLHSGKRVHEKSNNKHISSL